MRKCSPFAQGLLTIYPPRPGHVTRFISIVVIKKSFYHSYVRYRQRKHNSFPSIGAPSPHLATLRKPTRLTKVHILPLVETLKALRSKFKRYNLDSGRYDSSNLPLHLSCSCCVITPGFPPEQSTTRALLLRRERVTQTYTKDFVSVTTWTILMDLATFTFEQ